MRAEVLRARRAGLARRPSADAQPAATILHKPALARALPVERLPDTAERPLLILLRDLVAAQPDVPGYAYLREQIRGRPEAAAVEVRAGTS